MMVEPIGRQGMRPWWGSGAPKKDWLFCPGRWWALLDGCRRLRWLVYAGMFPSMVGASRAYLWRIDDRDSFQ